jgi:nucleoside-diphosphate-sugar epimerase
MKILITGSNGRIGRELYRALDDENDIRTLDKNQADLNVDIRDRSELYNSIDDSFDTIIHCAAQTDVAKAEENPAECFETNVNGTLNLILLGRRIGIEKFIYLSSREVYGDNLNASEEDSLMPLNNYGRSKMISESIVEDLCENSLILRPTNIFGIQETLLNTLETEDVSGMDFYNTSTDWIHIDDFMQAFHLLFDKHGIYNVGSGVNLSTRDLIHAFGKEHEVSFVETPHYRVDDFKPNLSKLFDLGFSPSQTMSKLESHISELP